MCRNVKMLFYTPLLPLGPSIRPPCPEYSGTCKPRGYPHTKGLNWFTLKPTFWCPEKQGCVPFWCPEKHSCVPWLFLPDLLTLGARAARPQPGPTCQPGDAAQPAVIPNEPPTHKRFLPRLRAGLTCQGVLDVAG